MGKFKEIDKLIKDSEKYLNIVAGEIAKTVRDELEKTYIYAIDNFYKSYDPIYYYRHGNPFRHTGGLYDGYHPVYINHYHNHAIGGIVISEENMPTDYQKGADYVLTNSLLGYHGHFSLGIPKAQPDPYRIIVTKYNCIIRNKNNYIDRAFKKVDKMIKNGGSK